MTSFKCSDGVAREFICLREHLAERGFDRELLAEDGNMLACTLGKDVGFFQALSQARKGFHLPFYFTYRSKAFRKRSPAGFYLADVFKPDIYVAFSPSLEDDDGEMTDSRMDSLTRAARKLQKFKKPEKRQPYFREQLAGRGADRFRFDCGYKLEQILYAGREEYLVFDTDFGIHGSIVGYCSKVYITTEQGDDASVA